MNIVIVLRMRNRRNVTSGHGDNKCEIAQRFGHRSIPFFFWTIIYAVLIDELVIDLI